MAPVLDGCPVGVVGRGLGGDGGFEGVELAVMVGVGWWEVRGPAGQTLTAAEAPAVRKARPNCAVYLPLS